MKKMTYFVMALALVLGFTQCKKEQLPTNNQTEGIRITLDVNGDNSNSRVNVNPTGADGYATVAFEYGDVIYVGYKVNGNNALVGTLNYNGETFSGSVNIPEIVTGEYLHFYFLGGVGFEPNVDGNTATVNISDQSSKYPVISYAPSKQPFTGEGSYSAKLQNKVSIMKFNVTTNSTAAICITGMNNEVTVNFNAENEDERFEYSMNADDGGLIKMPAKDENNVTWAIVLPQPALAAGSFGTAYTEDTNESNCYLGSRPSIPAISANQYIVSGVETMTMNTPKYVNLDGKYSYSGLNGQVLYNTGSGSMPGDLYISQNATVTLRNVNIHRGIDAGYQEGDTCTIVLEGVNHVDSENDGIYAAVHTPDGTTLVIKGSGTLYATGGTNGAGIGADYGSGECGNIRIEGGIIYATGGDNCAGIGGMYWDSRPCGDITITDGEVHATGGKNAPGIGSGNGGVCGNILISGGTVVAEGTKTGSAGIGTGMSGTCGNITITSSVTKVTAIRRGGRPIGLGSAGGDPVCGTVMFGDETMYNGTAWLTTPTNGNTYGGLNLTFTKTYLNNDTWILQP